MLELIFNHPKDSELKILCLGAHSDDIEIGCGGTILRLVDEYSNLNICWIVFSAQDQRAVEAQESAASFLNNVHRKRVIIKGFTDGYFPYIGAEVKDYFERLKVEFEPDLIFTHYRYDLHQDHRLISELTWNTYRNHLILEYEIPKYDGDLGSPNLFIKLDKATCEKKIKLILHHFNSQRKRHWFTDETFLSILRLRGVEAGSAGELAESFYNRKMVY